MHLIGVVLAMVMACFAWCEPIHQATHMMVLHVRSVGTSCGVGPNTRVACFRKKWRSCVLSARCIALCGLAIEMRFAMRLLVCRIQLGCFCNCFCIFVRALALRCGGLGFVPSGVFMMFSVVPYVGRWFGRHFVVVCVAVPFFCSQCVFDLLSWRVAVLVLRLFVQSCQ